MIAIDLQKFGGRGSSSGGGGGAGGGGTKASGKAPQKKESYEDTVKRITDSNGNVKTIANGLRYDVISVSGADKNKWSNAASKDFSNWTASETKEFMEGYHYDEKTGTFADEENKPRYKVKVSKKKKK